VDVLLRVVMLPAPLGKVTSPDEKMMIAIVMGHTLPPDMSTLEADKLS
jgi:hypothetical protein